jgi:hypothetical protein
VFDSTKAPVFALSKDDPNYDDAEEVRGSRGKREGLESSRRRPAAGCAALRSHAATSRTPLLPRLRRAAPRQGSYDLHEATSVACDRVQEYKSAVSVLLEEFFASGDAAEATATLGELAHPLYGHYFVKRAVR